MCFNTHVYICRLFKIVQTKLEFGYLARTANGAQSRAKHRPFDGAQVRFVCYRFGGSFWNGLICVSFSMISCVV